MHSGLTCLRVLPCRNDVKWVPCSARFALLGQHARGTGALQVFAMNHGKLEIMCETEKQQGFKCGTFGASSLEERHLATGDFDGRMAVRILVRLLPTVAGAASEASALQKQVAMCLTPQRWSRFGTLST